MTTYYCKRFIWSKRKGYFDKAGVWHVNGSDKGEWRGLGVVYADNQPAAYKLARERWGRVDNVYPLGG